MTPSKFRKRIQTIERMTGRRIDAVEILGNGHLRLILSDGVVSCSATPSCPFVDRKVAADIKRLSRLKQ